MSPSLDSTSTSLPTTPASISSNICLKSIEFNVFFPPIDGKSTLESKHTFIIDSGKLTFTLSPSELNTSILHYLKCFFNKNLHLLYIIICIAVRNKIQ